jgi:hypothetical protein
MSSSSYSIDGVFWITLSGAVIGVVGLAMKYCLRSKCIEINFCYGLIVVKRDVVSEEKQADFQIQHGISESSNVNNNVVTRQAFRSTRVSPRTGDEWA